MTILARFKINGHSMEPTLKENQIVLASTLPYSFSKPKIGDIIALKDPRDEKILIKRITKIENKTYFVMGDNMSDSTDSRQFGMIKRDQIIGKILL
jgi:nickel-type superoxide dismutase maturation protease